MIIIDHNIAIIHVTLLIHTLVLYVRSILGYSLAAILPPLLVYCTVQYILEHN
jgi:hypothetical protein